MFGAVKSLAAERRLLGWHSWETFAVPQGTWQGVVTTLLGQGPTVAHLPRGIAFNRLQFCGFVWWLRGMPAYGGMPALQCHLFEAGSAPCELIYWLTETACDGRSGKAERANPRKARQKRGMRNAAINDVIRSSANHTLTSSMPLQRYAHACAKVGV